MAQFQDNKLPRSGEMTQRFIEFIMMQAQQTALFLGRLPNPQTGKAEPNLDVARMLIDQLEMIREKTKGNLNHEETEILASILADLQLGYVQAGNPPAAAPAAPIAEAAEPPAAPADPPSDDAGDKKRFTKNYGS